MGKTALQTTGLEEIYNFLFLLIIFFHRFTHSIKQNQPFYLVYFQIA